MGLKRDEMLGKGNRRKGEGREEKGKGSQLLESKQTGS